MQEEHRQKLLASALEDPKSEVYRNMVNLCREADASARRSKERSGAVLVPFHLDEADSTALEVQFGVVIKLKRMEKRLTATSRVAGLVFLLDDALYEHASGPGRSMLFIDGDLMTVVARGLNRKIVERTHALARLSGGYFREDEQLRSFATARGGNVNRAADVMLRQLYDGGGENYFPRVRHDGPRVSTIVINHFKTPASPHQLAWLANCRGSVLYGTIFFQTDMLSRDSGDLVCFPGRYYIDRKNDLITLVPESDATLSISHPYSAWHRIITSNSITSGGKEYLCEKYKSVPGVVYYTMIPVGSDYEVSESLRTHFFDRSLLSVTKISFPKVRLSSSGVPVGYERGELLVNSVRLESVLSRLLNSKNDVVKPAEAFTVLMDHNNTSIVSLDHTKVPERMDVSDENELAMALALHVNWQRHIMRGTFRVMVDAIRARHALTDMSLYRFLLVAMSAWFRKSSVMSGEDDDMPMKEVVDWCGNDFTVLLGDADPWIEFVEVVGEAKETLGVNYPWFPSPPRPVGWADKLYERAVKAMGLDKEAPVERKKLSHNQLVHAILEKMRRSEVKLAGGPAIPVVVGENVSEMVRKDAELTDIKRDLHHKMQIDQGVVDESVPYAEMQVYEQDPLTETLITPVPDVEPISAMISDLEMCNGGPFERDPTDTGYRLAEVDIDKRTEAIMAINDAKRGIPAARWVRRPIVNAGSEGKRPTSQAALLGAVFKRNVGVPANRGSIDLDRFPAIAVDRVIDTCYRNDWQSIVERHLNAGMWQPNSEDVYDFVANVDEKKVRQLLDEFFLEGIVDLQRWMLMIKGKVKSGRESGSMNKVDHSQTILYLENSSTNAFYSSMMRRFKLCMTECLRPEVSVSAEESDEVHENWYNSLNPIRESHGRTYSYSIDLKVYDRSQDHVSLRVDLEWFRRHGLSKERLEIWIHTHGAKKAVSMMFGVVLTVAQQGISGDWKTLMRNSVVNLSALIVGMNVSRGDIVMMDVKGDDADIEVAKPLNIADTVECMSMTFNMSAKFQTNTVRYMCKQFRMKIDNRWIFVADPWARVQSVNTPHWIGNHEDSLKERWVSLVSELRHYDNGIAVDAVAEAAQQYYGTTRPLYQMARALSYIMRDFHQYSRLFSSPEIVF